MPTIYLDTCFFVIALESVGSTADPARHLLDRLKAKPGVAVTSELTIAELLAPTKRDQVMSLTARRSIYLSIFDDGGFIDLQPVTRQILLETVALREIYPQRLPDAVHIATAMTFGGSFFMSFDRDARRIPSGLEWVTPTKSDVEKVLATLDA